MSGWLMEMDPRDGTIDRIDRAIFRTTTTRADAHLLRGRAHDDGSLGGAAVGEDEGGGDVSGGFEGRARSRDRAPRAARPRLHIIFFYRPPGRALSAERTLLGARGNVVDARRATTRSMRERTYRAGARPETPLPRKERRAVTWRRRGGRDDGRGVAR